MTKPDTFVPGEWNFVCDECGRRFKSGVARKTWQGFYVCQRCWDPRHPQDFVKGIAERPVPPWVRPPREPFVYPGPTRVPALFLPPPRPRYLARGGDGIGGNASAIVTPTNPLIYPPDPFFSNVFLLANRVGLTVDSSSYNHTLSTGGSITLDSTYPLNGEPTYNVQPGGALYLSVAAHNTCLSLMGANEWCIEWWLKIVSYVAFRRTITYSPGIFFDTGLAAGDARWGAYINGTLYTVGPSGSSLTTGDFKHCALFRDNTSHATWSRLHFAVNGVVLMTSTDNIPKGDVMSSSSAFNFLGYDSFSPPVAFAGFRGTHSTRRYLTNTVGTAPNLFTPDPYPFVGG